MTKALTINDLNMNNPRQEMYIAFSLMGELREHLDNLAESYEKVSITRAVSVKGLIEHSLANIVTYFPSSDALEIVGYHNASSDYGDHFNLQARYYHPDLTSDASDEKLYEILNEFRGWVQVLGPQAGFYDTEVIAFVSETGLILPDVIQDNYDRLHAKDPIDCLTPEEIVEQTRLQLGDFAIIEMGIEDYVVVKIAEDGSCEAEATGLEYQAAYEALKELAVEAPSAGMRM